MAGALIGEGFISASIQVLCERITSREFMDLFLGKKLNESLLMKLKLTLLTLHAVLNDAEEKQIVDRAVGQWLDELKHAVFDAEDLLDEIDTEALRRKMEPEDHTSKLAKVRNLFSTSLNPFYPGMNAKLEKLFQRLEQLEKQKDIIGLVRKADEGKVSQRTPTTSLPHEPCVYGRDEDKENLWKMLLSDDVSSSDSSVITIVGMGGVGKTTLARLLYNDDTVKEHFTLKAWACVSEEYNAIRVTKTLLESVTSKHYDIVDFDFLQRELNEQIWGKKFLFVLDDLWNDNYYDWNVLHTPFTSGARGSKIIVTTRNKNVASTMNNVYIQHLQPLSHENCWSLLAKHAFGNENHSAHRNLEEIGKQIARKCNGLPLAAETLGGLLRCKIEYEQWNRILNSEIWQLPYYKSKLLPALGLSYHYLPAELKRCFVYCSIFPKDYDFQKQDVVRLWVAEGLIPKAESGKIMEDVAEEYFDELLSRSLFQKSSRWGFTMHDLINDLAMFVSKGFCSRLEVRESKALPERIRHLSYFRREFDDAQKCEPLYGLESLRTLLPMSIEPHHVFNSPYVGEKVLLDLLPSLRCLRVLSLSCYRNVTELPDSNGDLLHLRYLDLSDTAIVSLPTVVCNLYNLQTLLLSRCMSLTELPEDMRKLINLRTLMLAGCESLTKLPVETMELINLHHLDISGTRINEMPLQMGRLKSLRTLSHFVVGKSTKSTGSSIGELRELSDLRGKLSVLNMQNVVDAVDAWQASLKDKKYLRELELAWADVQADDSQKEKDVLEKLQPCINLEKLTIRLYGGTSFPKWLGESSFSKIRELYLSDCNYCLFLPSIGQLPVLQVLYIVRMKFVRTIGVEFYGAADGSSVSRPFQSLEELWIEEMPEWEEWLPSPNGGQCPDFPRLQELVLEECPKLRGSLPYHLPCLGRLTVSGCGVLQLYDDEGAATTATNLEMESFVEELEVKDGCPTGLLSSLLPSSNRLRRLSLWSCPTLLSFPRDGLPTTLTSLEIRNCKRLEFLPHEMMAKLTLLECLCIDLSCDSMRSFRLGIFPRLSSLTLYNCENLESLSVEEGVEENLRCLCLLRIEYCPNLVSFPPGGLFAPNLYEFVVSSCKNLKSLPERMHTLTALERLTIYDLPNVVSFAEGCLPPNLRDFQVGDCNRRIVKSVQYWGLKGLVSLREFAIGGRGSDEVLETLLKEQLLPTSLHTLHIFCLSSLKSLDGKGLGHLTSLQELRIESCPCLESLPGEGLHHLTSLEQLRISWCDSLQFLPEEGLPPSLACLWIEGCSALEKRYENKTGQDWANMFHVPCIQINDQVTII